MYYKNISFDSNIYVTTYKFCVHSSHIDIVAKHFKIYSVKFLQFWKHFWVNIFEIVCHATIGATSRGGIFLS